jgi:[acyl-carrier-protein] S-malonyltransferase
MARDLYDASSAVQEMFDRASEAGGLDLQHLLFEGTEDQLKQTDVTQVAITLVNLCAAHVLSERGITPSGCAGFSLGEYAALVTAGVISPTDVFPLVKTRGELSAKAAAELEAGGDPPGMSAVIGLSPDQIIDVIADSTAESVYPANLNSPKQTVIAGLESGLNQIEGELKEAGARRVIRLKVTGAFHTPLMSRITDEFEAALARVEFSNPEIPVYSNVSGRLLTSAEEAKRRCLEQLTNPVQWVTEEQAILGDGYDDVLEVGPGTVLCGLWKSAPGAENLTCYPAGTLAAMDELPNN